MTMMPSRLSYLCCEPSPFFFFVFRFFFELYMTWNLFHDRDLPLLSRFLLTLHLFLVELPCHVRVRQMPAHRAQLPGLV